MASVMTVYGIQQLLNNLFGKVAAPIPATWYFGFFNYTSTGSIPPSGAIEVGPGVGYARVPVANNSTNFPATSGLIKTNGTAIIWPQSTGPQYSWGDTAIYSGSEGLLAWGIWDAATGGNLWFWGNITNSSSENPNKGDSPMFSAGVFQLTL